MSNLVMIESPYRNGDRATNLRYLAWCEYHSAEWCGEFPIASHGNCTAYWPEDDEHRAKGFAWREKIRGICELSAYYEDLGISEGAREAMSKDFSQGRPYSVRKLPTFLLAKFEAGEFPPGTMRKVPVLP